MCIIRQHATCPAARDAALWQNYEREFSGVARGGAHPVGTVNALVRGPESAYVELIARQ